MRILFITSVYPSPYGATRGTFNAAMVTGLHLAGNDVRVVAPVPWVERFRRRAVGVTQDGVEHPTWFYPPRLAFASRHRWMRLAALPSVRRITEEWQPDVVVGYWTHPDGTVALEAARRLGVPGVLIVGGSDILLLTETARRRRIIVQTLLEADHVLAVGGALRERVIALGIPADRVGTLHRGVDRQRFAPGDGHAARARLGLPPDRPIVLWVGRMVPVKGLDLLLAAWQQVQRVRPDALLILAGDGEVRPELEVMIRQAALRVRLIGSIPHASLAEWYRAVDTVVLPSRSEGVPNVLLEALACGTPFVASDVGGVRDLLEPSSQVVPAGQIPALAEALLQSIQGPPLSRRATSAHIPDRSEGIAGLQRTLAGLLPASRGGTES